MNAISWKRGFWSENLLFCWGARCLFHLLCRLSFFANSYHARIQGAGQGVERCMDSIMDQASHWMGVGTIELHCMEVSPNCSNEPSIPTAIGITAHFWFLNCAAGLPARMSPAKGVIWVFISTKLCGHCWLMPRWLTQLPCLLLSSFKLHVLAVFCSPVSLAEDITAWCLARSHFSWKLNCNISRWNQAWEWGWLV